jgi:hypothetical protein
MPQLCYTVKHLVRFQVITVVNMKMTDLWDVASFSLVEI